MKCQKLCRRIAEGSGVALLSPTLSHRLMRRDTSEIYTASASLSRSCNNPTTNKQQPRPKADRVPCASWPFFPLSPKGFFFGRVLTSLFPLKRSTLYGPKTASPEALKATTIESPACTSSSLRGTQASVANNKRTHDRQEEHTHAREQHTRSSHLTSKAHFASQIVEYQLYQVYGDVSTQLYL